MTRRLLRLRAPLSAAFVLLLLLALYLVFRENQATPSPVALTEIPSSGSWYQVLFTDPEAPASASLRGGPDDSLAAALDTSRYSVDVAVFRLDLWSIRDALLRAHRRGVVVRVVTDSDNLPEDEIVELQAGGIPVVGDHDDPLMHHKFVVVDRLEVWTGSMNLTVNGAYRNNNNLVRIRSRQLAEDYTREFEEMFLDGRFGSASRRDTPHPRLEVGGFQLEAFFSPDDSPAARIVEVLHGARESIDFMAYSLTLNAIGEALLERAATGVRVRGVIERNQATNQGSEYQPLRDAGLDVRLDNNPGNMHHKVIIIDGSIVITGSYNFSRSAEELNDENLLILHTTDLASQYLIEFEQIFGTASP